MKTRFIVVAGLVVVCVGGYFLLNKLPKTPSNGDPSYNVKIIDGNVCQVFAESGIAVLVDKNDFDNIDSFFDVAVSPDNSKLCFLGQSMVPMWMFYSDSDGKEVTRVGVAKNCVWSNDSQTIAFNNHTTDVSPVNVLIYNTVFKETLNLTASTSTEDIMRVYDIPVWSADDSQITSQFTGINFVDQSQSPKGVATIIISTGEVVSENTP